MMQNHQYLFPKLRLNYDVLTNTLTSQNEVGYHAGHYFTVTGFGPNTGRKFVDPVSGELQSQKWNYPQGQLDYINTAEPSGQILSHSRSTGAMANSHGTRLFSFYHPPAYDNNVYNDALSDFYEGVRKSETNLALTIGEARETGRMLKVGKSIYEVLTLARRAKRQALTNPSKTLSEIWLSYKYGWQPCLRDIYNYLNWAYTSFDEGIPVRGRSRKREQVSDILGSVSSSQGRSHITGHIEWKSEVKCWLGLDDTASYNRSRITSLNPLSIAWELLTLSFVVDWFFDVGGYLQNMEAALGAGVSFKRGYTTEIVAKDLRDQWNQDLFDQSGGFGYKTVGSLESKHYWAFKRRTRLYGLPFPRRPSLKVNLGSQRILSAAALIRVILLGRVR